MPRTNDNLTCDPEEDAEDEDLVSGTMPEPETCYGKDDVEDSLNSERPVRVIQATEIEDPCLEHDQIRKQGYRGLLNGVRQAILMNTRDQQKWKVGHERDYKERINTGKSRDIKLGAVDGAAVAKIDDREDIAGEEKEEAD